MISQNTHVELFGKIEALGYRWTTYTKLHKQYLETRAIYSKLISEEISTKSIHYQYKYHKSKVGEYIALGKDKPMTIRHNRVFYIDEQCSLVFSAAAEMTLTNVSMRCFY
ncbi:hypothetical protein [Vibrio taketomensis]|uniref:hypothetical protein n=1 Tax=Vibrio taketomensis TaxID=2572923 RepID=UPI001E5FA911|nr:hypothetical protein [Vibrio taketomensis]